MSETVDESGYDPEQDEPHDTGWSVLTGNQSVVKMIDAIMNLPSDRGVTKTELAERAEVSRQSVYNHIDKLVYLDILEPIPETSPQRYRFDHESEVSEAIIRLEGAMNKKGPNA